MAWISLGVAWLVGYLLGALPFGAWVARARGVDIFSVGSGNPGATNVKRSVGKGAGNLVFALDFLKGALAALWPLLPWGRFAGDGMVERMQVAGLVGAIVGHSYSCFIGFRGGKGVSSSLGGLLALCWPVALIGVAVWLLVFFATRFVSLASLLLAVSLPVASWLLGRGQFLTSFFALLALFIVLRHRSNIERLLNGTEHKFAKGASDSAAADDDA